MKAQRRKEWLAKRKLHQQDLSSEQLLAGIKLKNISALSSAITLIESASPKHRQIANDLIQHCLPIAGKSIRIGITGVPGVGKSTFIENFGLLLHQLGKKVAILAIDPSSNTSGGSILGDKTRMNELSRLEDVFIRPSPAGDSLGGVARKTRESIILCEAAGFDVIIIETVGVGQSETAVHSMTDFFLLLMLSGAGDELQGIKRGIMEMADALVITKADGDNIRKANVARREYENAMHLFPAKESGWIPKAMTCSSIERTNLQRIWEVIESYRNATTINGWFENNRKQQDIHWLKETLDSKLLQAFYENSELRRELLLQQDLVAQNKTTSYLAAEKLFEQFLKSINGNGI